MSRPGALFTPSETNIDTTGPSPILYSASHPWNHELLLNSTEPSLAHSTPTPESAGARFRKISSITYLTPGLKDSRERALKRSPKPLVIILPPTSLIQQHGQLGHTLASGPRHRLSNGLLMPLFPTMYGQLTAIAREFNFPSTTGLCLYLHFVENGVTMAPRISDETWPFIWAHVFEVSSVPKSPLSGKIEFDLDMHQARWYAAWLASSRRENHSSSVFPSDTPSVNHERDDSKPTVREEHQEMIHSTVPTTRHVPRKLSLVDRYEMHSGSGFLLASRTAISPPVHIHPSSSPTLSPIFQDAESKSIRQDLDDRVNSWRSSAILRHTSLVATGDTSLGMANMPNSPSIDDTLLDIPNEQLNLEDYTWSVTSAGPDDYDPVSSVSWERVPSVHIANRLEGSVCLTPSDCTSFGPFDCTLTSPAPSIYRLPSPDIAYRMFEDAPQTPIGTTWGAPIEYPPSPAFFPQPPSVDLGERMVSSRPVTPVTATSWGPASWPSSPIHTEYTPNSVHLGDRGDFSRPVTPSTATSWGVRLSWLPSSATPFYGATFDAGHHGFEDTKHELGRSSASWSSTIGASGSRSRRAPVDTPWGHSWPYREFGSTRPSPQIFICVPSIYPHLVIYQSVYPHFDLYPRATLAEDSSPGYTDSSLYVDVSPPTTRDALAVQRAISVRLTPCYPVFDLYPAVYPDNLYKIYPPVFASTLSAVDLVSIYPFFNLYPSRSYPSQRTPATQNLDIETQKMQRYPNLGPYPASNGRIMSGNLKVPDHDFGYSLAQSVKVSRNSKAMEDIPVQSETSSFFTTDPTVYPHFNIYPSLILSTVAVVRPAECSARLATYPFFDLYPAVYPAFEIYPQAEGANSPANKVVGSRVLGYPYIEIYTPLPTQEILSRKSLSVRAPPSYPTINLYPLVYPFIEPYPVLSYDVFRTPKLTGYPDFDLYPENAPSLKMLHNSSDHTGYVYPIFNLYPAVYPYFDLYPVVGGMVQVKKAARPHTGTVSVKIKPNYPAVSTYSTVYSRFELGPSIDLPRTGLVPRPKSLKPLDNPTNNELHAIMAMERARSTPVKPSRFNTRTNSHADPHCAVFPDGIVTTPSSVWDNDSPREVASQSNNSSEALWGQVSTRTLWSNNTKLPSPVLNHDSRSTTFIASESTKDGILPLQISRRAYLL